MTLGDVLQEFWPAVRGALCLNSEAISIDGTSATGIYIGLMVLLTAGFSQAVGQSIVLFINRVRPIRFGLSLIASSVLFVFSYLFWALSLWLASDIFLRLDFGFIEVAQGLAICYAPQMLSFLVALPYLGMPISVLLSLWTFLGILVGLEATAELTIWGALVCSTLGWVVLQLSQRTIGRPLGAFSRWLRDTLAGTSLVTDPQALEEIVMAGNPVVTRSLPSDWIEEAVEQIQSQPRRRLLQFLAISFAVFLGIGLLSQPQGLLDLGLGALTRTARLTLRLAVISVTALLFASLLTPLEALSWWAGWREPEALNPGRPVNQPAPGVAINRYVTYLDGISQGSYLYTAPVERFLAGLAAALPKTVLLVKGIIPYSVANQSLGQQRRLGFLWRMIDTLQTHRWPIPVGFIVNIRNLVAVAVSTDARYGPIQNQGLAQVLYDSLLYHGYEPDSGIPVTLIGSSGGGQMAMGALPFLKRALNAPIQVISISGVISGNVEAMEAEQLYHLVGDRDSVAWFAGVMFPSRWSTALLSNWNRARRRGRISQFSLGPVKHNGPQGPYGAEAYLPDGRSHLQQTVELVTGILLQDWAALDLPVGKASNYSRYRHSPYNRPETYPIRPLQASYRPQASWMGRLILPPADQRQPAQVCIELHHAPQPYQHWIGQVVSLGWSQTPDVLSYLERSTYDVTLAEPVRIGKRQGNVYPERLDHRRRVDPLESLAGAHPHDDVNVLLPEPVEVDESADLPVLRIRRDPIAATGRYYALVQFCAALGSDRFRVKHYSRQNQGFNGPEEIVLMPEVVTNRDGVRPFSNDRIECSALNHSGWYIFGSQNSREEFVVQAIAPRCLFELAPDQVITGRRNTLNYINFEYWKDIVAKAGQVRRVLLLPGGERGSKRDGGMRRMGDEAKIPPPCPLHPRDRLLVMHLFGGIGGKHSEFAPLGIYFGHFSFGQAWVVPEPLTGELRFNIEYRQIYTNNPNGTVAGSNHWTRYMGSRQFGWIGCRPVSDILVRFPPLTQDYDFDGVKFSPLDRLMAELDVMAARYRVGDGTGMTFRNLVNSCVQDSAQALYNGLRQITTDCQLNPQIQDWLRSHPDHPQTQRFWLLVDLVESLKFNLEPFGFVRSDWKFEELTLGRFAEETPGKTLLRALASWRSVLPRLANDVIAMVLLQLGATLWVIGVNQAGGENPDIEAIAPTDFSFRIPKIKRFSRYDRSGSGD